MGKLAGRVAAVTGAGRGIGREIALKLASEGAAVLVNDLDAKPCDDTVAAVGAAGGRAAALAGDVAAPDFGDRLVAAAVERFGGLDILVNNAGYVWNTAIHNASDEQWEAMIAVHATGPFRILRAAARYFRERAQAEAPNPRCRKVVNISSISGTGGAATQSSYAAAKMAVVGLTRSLAKEWGAMNVTVNAVAFGAIDTRLTQGFNGAPPTVEVHGQPRKVGIGDAARTAITQAIPLRRFGTPADAAGAVYLLCIPESDYVSGQVLICGGGLE